MRKSYCNLGLFVVRIIISWLPSSTMVLFSRVIISVTKFRNGSKWWELSLSMLLLLLLSLLMWCCCTFLAMFANKCRSVCNPIIVWMMVLATPAMFSPMSTFGSKCPFVLLLPVFVLWILRWWLPLLLLSMDGTFIVCVFVAPELVLVLVLPLVVVRWWCGWWWWGYSPMCTLIKFRKRVKIGSCCDGGWCCDGDNGSVRRFLPTAAAAAVTVVGVDDDSDVVGMVTPDCDCGCGVSTILDDDFRWLDVSFMLRFRSCCYLLLHTTTTTTTTTTVTFHLDRPESMKNKES